MPLTGDHQALAQLTAAIDRAAAGALVKNVSKQVSIEGQGLIGEAFRTGTSPDGARWAPLTARSGQPLRDTGRLAASITTTDTGKGFIAGTNVAYGAVHQTGAVITAKKARTLYSKKLKVAFGKKVTIPARPFLPVGGLPAKWEARFDEAAEATLVALLGLGGGKQ